MLEGKTVIYYSSGTIKEVFIYRKGFIVGTAKTYYPSGKLKSTTPYTRPKNTIYGIVSHFYENGQVEKKGKQYKNKKIGVWEYFDENSNLIKKETYNKKGALTRTQLIE